MIGDQPVCVPHFVPLKTKQGMHPNELLRRLDGRALVIWGCGHMGRAMVRVLRKFCAPETTLFFCDRRAALIGTRVDGVPVLSVDTAIHDARDRRSMVVVAVGGGLAEIVRQAEESGLRHGEDLVTFRRLARPEASIQILRGEQLMTLAAYNAAVRKLVREVPHLFQVELIGSPDPLLHPDLPRMIEAVRDHTACVVASGLQSIEEAVRRTVNSGPSLFVLRAGSDYAPWQLRTKLALIAKLREEGSLTEFRVNYVRRRADTEAIRHKVTSICAEFGIPLVTSHGYVEYDRLLDYCRGTATDPTLKSDISGMSWDLEAALEFARIDQDQPCLCQRIFPVINHDLSVAVCHLYERPRVAGDFLAQSYDSLIEERHRSEHCKECQEHALHRLDVDVLESRHEKFKLPGEESYAGRNLS